jgi:Rod binding domain-containing protein
MLVDEYGKAIVKAGGIRLADTIVRQLLSIQEHAQQRKEETR